MGLGALLPGLAAARRFVPSGRRGLLDTFTAANGTALAGRVPEIGGAWATADGSMEIQSNRATPLAPTIGGGIQTSMAVAEASLADGTLTANVLIGNATVVDAAGVVFRYTDNSNFWQVRLNRPANQVQLFEHAGGVVTSRGTGAVTLSVGQALEIRVVLSGTSITVFVDGVSKITYSSASSNQTATKAGPRIVQTDPPTAEAAVSDLQFLP